MNSQRPQRSSMAFEYFLYAAIVAETALAALVYKIIFRDPDLARVRAYFAIFYFAFLAWAISQLNRLHRKRTARPEEEESVRGTQEPEQTALQPIATPRGERRSVLGLTAAQLVIVVVVFATAVATFSWALRLLP